MYANKKCTELTTLKQLKLDEPTTEYHTTTNGYQNRNTHTMRQLPGPNYTQPQYTQL
jgi:hypothetical protein